ncbi:hypothetical protein CEXT_744581 [Caerostris extrusa]|uniref:Uncharacterized protein n=1 Tax=Caerostris extrusa TaxID=172846 RepID=A0AAV4ML85_CAEEX|nr:hypothetical protein CEXT_744581 [Caerostris extrusa]
MDLVMRTTEEWTPYIRDAHVQNISIIYKTQSRLILQTYPSYFKDWGERDVHHGGWNRIVVYSGDGDLKQTIFHCEPAERLSGGSEVVGLKFSILKPLEAEEFKNLNEADRKWLTLLDYTSIWNIFHKIQDVSFKRKRN